MSKTERQSRERSRLRFLPSLKLNNKIPSEKNISMTSNFITSRRGWTNQNASSIYLDRTRHEQLLLANTRYCCHTAVVGLSSGRSARRHFKIPSNSLAILKYSNRIIIITITSLLILIKKCL